MSEQYFFKNVQLAFFVLYSLEEFLGNGQFGSVSKATWTTPGGSKKVAVKIMRPSVLDTTRVKFLQEAAIMGQFFHSNVVKLHGVVSVGEPVCQLAHNVCHLETVTVLVNDVVYSETLRNGFFVFQQLIGGW